MSFGYISSPPPHCSPRPSPFPILCFSRIFRLATLSRLLQAGLQHMPSLSLSPVPPFLFCFSSLYLTSYLHRVSGSPNSLLFPQPLYFLFHYIYHSCLGSAPPAVYKFQKGRLASVLSQCLPQCLPHKRALRNMNGMKLGETTHLSLVVPTETRTGAIGLKMKSHPMLNPYTIPSLQITGGEYTVSPT